MWDMFRSRLITNEELRIYVGLSIKKGKKVVTDNLLLQTDFAEPAE
jgi:hypothetical protein